MKLYLVNVAVCPLPSDLLIEDLKSIMLSQSGVTKDLESAKTLAKAEVDNSLDGGWEGEMSDWTRHETKHRDQTFVWYQASNGKEDDEEVFAMIREIEI